MLPFRKPMSRRSLTAALAVCAMLAMPASQAATDLYRLVWTDDPATTVTIGWRQLSGTFVKVRYRERDDAFAAWQEVTTVRTGVLVNVAEGPDTGDPSGVVPTQDPFETHFVDLSGLSPDTDYEFEICDSEDAPAAKACSPYMYFRTAPATRKPFTLIAGGDSRRTSSALFGVNDQARRRGFELVAKIRPLAVVFSGDFMDEGVYGEWLIWMDEWQLTKSADGRMYPLIPSHGNHENQDRRMLSKVFGTSDLGAANGWGTFGALSIGGDLMRIFTLNSSLDPTVSASFQDNTIGYNDLIAEPNCDPADLDPEVIGTPDICASPRGDEDISVNDAWATQTAWLQDQLAAAVADGVLWKLANYHHPLRPHESGKDDGVGRVRAWGPLFDTYDLDLAIESDTHNLKYTLPIVPGDNLSDARPGAPVDEGFVEADWANGRHGTVFIGEGSWGAPKRAANDGKQWTLASDSVWQFKLLQVDETELTVHTVLFEESSYPNGVHADVDALTQAAQDADPLAMPAGLDLWRPFEDDLALTLRQPGAVGEPTFLEVTPRPVVPQGTGSFNDLASWSRVTLSGDRNWRFSDFGNRNAVNVNGFDLAPDAPALRAYLVSPPIALPADVTDFEFLFAYRYQGETDPAGVGAFELLLLDDCTLTGSEAPATLDALSWETLRSSRRGAFAGPESVWTEAPGVSLEGYEGSEVCFAFRYDANPVVARRFGVDNIALGEFVEEAPVPGAPAGTVRFAMFNALLSNRGVGVLESEMATTSYAQAQGVAEIIQRVRPDVILLNEFDYYAPDPADSGTRFERAGPALKGFVENYLERSQNGQAPMTGSDEYRYMISFPSNTGLQPEDYTDPQIDCNFNNPDQGCVEGDVIDAPGTAAADRFDDGNDAFGFGLYEGAFGMAILSKYPIDYDAVRTFQEFLWRDMPSSLIPDRAIGALPQWYSNEEAAVYRLSSKNHVDVPILVDVGGIDEVIHVLGSHPTPPVFDDEINAAGEQCNFNSALSTPELCVDPHGRRNHDEIRFWADYVSKTGHECYAYDDAGVPGCLGPGRRFVVMGDQNADPQFGDSFASAILQLLNEPNVDDGFTPVSGGATGTPPYATLDNGEWRLDYALASAAGLDYRMDSCDPFAPGYPGLACGVFYPSSSSPLAYLVNQNAGDCPTPNPGDPAPPCPSSDHRLVWVDVEVSSPDSDGDGVVDEVDNCAGIANGEQADLDADLTGDRCDDDADGDGLPKAWEQDFGYDDLDPLDALADDDGDGRITLTEFDDGTDPRVADTAAAPVQVPVPAPALFGGALVMIGTALRRRRRAVSGAAQATVLALTVGMSVAAPRTSTAETLTIPAFDVATVRPDGPRSGTFGKRFFNVEGRNNGRFANYGVVRFALDDAVGDVPATLEGVVIESAELVFTQSNAGFTQTGNVAVYYTSDDTTPIASSSSIAYDEGFTFDPANPLLVAEGNAPFSGDFPGAVLLGGNEFFETSTGEPHAIPLTRSLTLLADADGTLTLVLSEFNDEDMAATYAGTENTLPAPELRMVYSPAAP